MAAGSPQGNEVEWFTAPQEANQRRYEALRAFFVEGLTHAQAGERFGYTRWGMINLVREYRAGRLPRTARLDLATRPTSVETGKAGLLLLVPDLVGLDLPGLVSQAGYSGT